MYREEGTQTHGSMRQEVTQTQQTDRGGKDTDTTQVKRIREDTDTREGHKYNEKRLEDRERRKQDR